MFHTIRGIWSTRGNGCLYPNYTKEHDYNTTMTPSLSNYCFANRKRVFDAVATAEAKQELPTHRRGLSSRASYKFALPTDAYFLFIHILVSIITPLPVRVRHNANRYLPCL